MLWKCSHRYKNIENPNGWIYRLSKNTAIDFYNKHIRKHKNAVSLNDSDKIIKLPAYNAYEKFEFISYLTQLDDLDKNIITMKILFKFTFAEIADELHIKLYTVTSRYLRALKKLEKQESQENKKENSS